MSAQAMKWLTAVVADLEEQGWTNAPSHQLADNLRAVLKLAREAAKRIPPTDTRNTKCSYCGKEFRRSRGSCPKCYGIDFAALRAAVRELRRRVRLIAEHLADIYPAIRVSGRMAPLLDLRKPLPKRGRR